MKLIKVKSVNSMGRTDGCRDAPDVILEALRSIGCNEEKKLIDVNLIDEEEAKVVKNDLEETNKSIYTCAKIAFSSKEKVLFLGGDHSISYPIVSAMQEVYIKPFLIVFDAHADCVQAGKEPTHEDWARKIVEDGFPKENIILIGVRNMWKEEVEFISNNKISVVDIRRAFEEREDICDMIMERARKAEAFYISVDIDSVDPAFAPGTGYPEPGGLTSRELIYFLQRLTLLKNFKGADIVEIDPSRDDTGITVKLGAKILTELI